ncbi:MAG: calcium/sodium antiporter [Bacteroidetes bacterium]|nr:calcium/sodium antiporter [Bacteroidota bacterium]MBU1579628.1 calcium/sodium antiporter [Bacteroidota bacterium]MBU2464716.1 calcium/sodium antiporter [Bacteroidota bacterium]MBU2557763.1 calcium/sodium antiporter [Bacteroidota bacterium]
MIITIGLLILGLLLLVKGADWLVSGASAIARYFKVTDLAIGLTIVAFGTSAPELVVNGFAAFEQSFDLVFGNVIGSNNFNLFVILGITGLVAPIKVQSSTVWKEIPLSLFAAVLILLIANSWLPFVSSGVSRLEAVILLIIFAGFLYYVFSQLKSDAETQTADQIPLKLNKSLLLVIVGLAGLVGGGRLVVQSAVELAQQLCISEKVIGLTIVAAGTSLPELVTSVVAALRKNTDIAVGNIIGSNIFNLLFILPISALIHPLVYNTAFNTDLLILAGGTILLFVAMFTGIRKKLDRWEAGLLFAIYIAYTIVVIANG